MAFDVSLYEQTALFVYAVLVGALIGAIYDAFRVVRIALTMGRGTQSRVRFERIETLILRMRSQSNVVRGKCLNGIEARFDFVVVFVCDVLFFLATSVVSVVFLYQANYGQPRLYVFVSVILGFAAYYNTVGRTIAFTSGVIISLFRLASAFLIYRLVTPLIKVTCRTISVPVETLKLKNVTDRSEAFANRLAALSEKLFGYSSEVSKKEDGYENGREKNRHYSKDSDRGRGAFLHRKDRQLQNRVFASEGLSGNAQRRDRILFRRGR